MRRPCCAPCGGQSSHAADVPWLDIAAKLGADVPVCMGDRPALMRGIGEILRPLRVCPKRTR